MVSMQEVFEVVCAELLRDYSSTSQNELRDLLVLGLAEEAGEVAGLRKRNLRHNARDAGRGSREEYVSELGDVLWYFMACCEAFDINPDEVWEHNRQKLEERYGNVNSTSVSTIG